MITSTANPLIKDLVRLKTRRYRDQEGRFVIEGERNVRVAIDAGMELELLVVAPELGAVEVPGARSVVEVGSDAFRKASMRQNPDGFLAVASHLGTSLAELRLPPEPLILLVEAIEKPGNLGAILRTCDAVGVDAVAVTDPTADIHNPNVVHASQGALFTVPLGVASQSAVLGFLDERGVAVVAATPHGGRALWDSDLTGAKAVAVGAESTGLSPALLEAATDQVVIPMFGTVDSLNASVSAAVLLYEALRQRR